MMKRRLTITADENAVEAGLRAVREGEASSLSQWANVALAEKAERDQRLRALQEALDFHESESGGITAEEVAAQIRADRETALVVRGRGQVKAA